MNQINSNFDLDAAKIKQSNHKNPVKYACIPAFNEELSIGKIVLQAQKYVDMVIVCDDGSVDYTAEIAEALGAYVIRHERNEGKGAALRDLFKFALSLNPDIVVVLDADGQHDPLTIPKMFEPILEGNADVVIGSRFVKGSKTDAPLYRRFGLFLLNRNPGGNIKDVQSGLRAFTRNALEIMTRARANDFGVELEQVFLATKYNLKIKEIPVEIRYNGIFKTSKRHPIVQGMQIIRTFIRLNTDEYSRLYLGISSLVFMVGILSGVLFLLDYFNYYFNQFYALVFLMCFSLGILIGISSSILHKLSNFKTRV